MAKVVLFVFCALVFTSVYVHNVNGALPAYIRPCSRSHSKLNECALRVAKAVSSTFAKGDEALGIPPLEPLKVKEINTFGNSGPNGIKIVLKDNVMSGVGDLEVKKINIDIPKQRLSVKLFGNLKLDSIYELSGRLLIIPLSGKGKSVARLRNLKVEYYFDYELYKGADGREYLKIIHDDVKYDVGKATFKLDNLFNGDKVLGESTNALLNQIWKDVLEEVGPPVAQALKQGVTDSVQAFLKHVAYEEFLLP